MRSSRVKVSVCCPSKQIVVNSFGLRRKCVSTRMVPSKNLLPRLATHQIPVTCTRLQPRKLQGERTVSSETLDNRFATLLPKQWCSKVCKEVGKISPSIPLLGFATGISLEGPQSVAQAIGTLAAIIFVHECGHFFAARLQNIYVTKFSVGFGPKLFSYQGKEVEYSLRAIPLGGFVAFPDDDPDSEIDKDDPNLLKNRPIFDRALVISAGVIANTIFAAAVLFAQVTAVGLNYETLKPGVLVPDLVPMSVAARSGIQKNDVILSVDGKEIVSSKSSVQVLVQKIKDSPEKSMVFHINRAGEELDLDLTPELAKDGGGRIGVSLAPNADVRRVKAESAGEAVRMTAKEFNRLTGTVVGGLTQIVTNFAATADQVSGPVAIVATGAEVARNDATGLYQFAAIVNINLAVVNVLPLPALDGGYLALLVVEAARGGKKLPEELEQAVQSSGFLLLLTLGVWLIVRDTLKLIG